MEPLTQEEIDVLWKELQSKHPFDSSIPLRWYCIAEWVTADRCNTGTLEEYWNWKATHIMLVLAANDALDIQE